MLNQDIYINNWEPFSLSYVDTKNNQFQLNYDSIIFDLKFIDEMIILNYPIDEELEKKINIIFSTIKFNSYIYKKIYDVLIKYIPKIDLPKEHNKTIFTPELYLNHEKIYYKYPIDEIKLVQFVNDDVSKKVINMILHEIKQINTNKSYPHFIQADTLFNFTMNLFDGKNKIILNVEIEPKSYPFSPPIISWEYPKISLNKLAQFYGCEIFNKKWNPVVTLEYLIKEFTNQFKLNNFFGNDKFFTHQENLFTKLFSLNKMLSTETPLQLNYNAIDKSQNSNEFWKKGTGYGYHNSSNWTIDEYIKESNLINKRIIDIMIELKNNLKSIPPDFNNKFYEFLNNEISSLNLLELEKKSDYYFELFSLITLVDKTKLYNLEQFVKDSIGSLSLIPKNKYPAYLKKLIPFIKQFEITLVPLNKLKHDKIFTQTYEEIMKPIQFDYLDIEKNKYKYQSYSGKPSSPKQMIRLAQDISALKNSMPLNKESTVWIRWDKTNLTKMQFIISGPKDTPYQDGLFLFDCYFPKNYPSSPPLINLQTTGGGSVRFNPNLYNCGKVCLSLLGTWPGEEGESWNEKTSTLLQIIVSIQSLILIDEPYFNEPGYQRIIGTARGKSESFAYNDNIRMNTMKWAILDMIKNPPSGFEDIVKEHFKFKINDIKETTNKWTQESKQFNLIFQELILNLKCI